VDYIGPRHPKQFFQVIKTPHNGKPFSKLPRHQRLPVTHTNYRTSADSLDLPGVLIRNLATPD
jgi:hypothetical protein